MTYLSLSLLGPFQAWTANGSLQTLRTLKERALLAYLALENSRSHRRETLAELFWPDRSEGVARNNLRQALYGIRQAVGTQGFDALFYVTADEVRVNPGDQLWLDINAFAVHVNIAREHEHHRTEPCPYCIQHLRDAVELYRGDFLEDVLVDKNAAYQSWVVQRRERFASQYAQTLEVLIENYDQMGDYAQAAFYARRQAQMDGMKEYQQRRLMSLLARNGHDNEALDVFETYRDHLANLHGAVPDEKTAALAAQIREGSFEVLSPAAPPAPHNLPEQLTPFIGRETELFQLARLFENPAIRLISLVGLAGVGKTRLAVEATRIYLRLFADGVFYVSLDSVFDAGMLGEVIGRVVGLVPGGQKNMRDLLVEYLRLKRVLIILDNFEHLLEGRDFLLDLLQNLPFLKILVTSRERLALQAEYLVELNGLAFPSPESIQEGQAWHTTGRSDALRLLYERASRVHPGAAWKTGQLPVLHEREEVQAALRICQLVDGLPLAIELAASWARDFSFDQIADEVQRSLEFLQTSLHDVPKRHRSLRAAFEHSWELLSESEQEVFCRLAVFPGSFSPAAAQVIASAALPWLLRLQDKSLVRRVAYGRFELHPLIRQFAGQKLRQYSRKVEDAARQQHAEYFCNFMKERENQIRGPRLAEALVEVETELDNIVAAWDWAAEHGFTSQLENAAVPLLLFFESRSRWQEGEECFRRALAHLAGNNSLSEAHKRLQASLMSAQGWLCCRLSRFQQSEELLSTSLRMMEGGEPFFGLIFTQFAFSFLCVWLSRFEEARVHLLTCLTISQRIGDAWGEAWSRQLLTEIAFESGQLEMNYGPFLDTLAMFDRLGEKRGCSRALNYLANIAIAQGQHTDAQAYLEKMMSIAERLGDVWGAAGGYNKLGQLAAVRGEYEQAWRLHERGLEMLQKMGDQRRAAYTMRQLGDIAVSLENEPAAEKYYRLSLETARQTQSAPLAEDVLVSVAWLLTKRAQPQRAVHLLRQVLRSSLGDPFTASRARGLLESLTGGEAVAEAQQEPGRLWDAINGLLQSDTAW